MNSYVEQYYRGESRIINEECRHLHEKNQTKADDMVKQARKPVDSPGDENARSAWADLDEAYEQAEIDEEKSFIANQMITLGFQAMTTNYGWMK